MRSGAAEAEDGRRELAARLAARRGEIEQAVLDRVYGISAPLDSHGPEYAEGLRAAISAAVGYGIAVVECGEEHAPPIPPVLLSQARMAARSGVNLDTVLRRYFAGHSLVGDFLVEEAERQGTLRGDALQRLLRAQAALFERLVAAVSDEHAREAEQRNGSGDARRAERVERLLAGELLDTAGLAYDLEALHLGAIAVGPEARERIGGLAASLDCRLLAVRRDEVTVWAWLGSRRGVDPVEIERVVRANWPPGVSLALGEPAPALAGWRLTHQQARAALPLAIRGPEPFVRYVDVALLASMLQDDLLATSLRQLYLEPLECERDGGEVLRRTLRAYFAADRNIASAAAALGVSRRTVANRIATVEQIFDQTVSAITPAMEAALSIDESRTLTVPK